MYQGHFLTGRKGNNSFSYDYREKHLGNKPQLWVPGCKSMELKELFKEEVVAELLEGKVVFEDVDEHEQLQSCEGLNYFVRTEFEAVPLLLFDNHNHALFFWYEAFLKGKLKRGAKLVHVDQHKDMREAGAALSLDGLTDEASLKEVFRYTNESVNVGNYIKPALEEGLISEVQLVTGEAALEEILHLDSENMILNIDLDFFVEDLAYIDFDKAKNFILQHAKKAKLITVATSPFFIDQREALEFFRSLFR